MGCDRFVIMDPNYGMYCHFQWKIRKKLHVFKKIITEWCHSTQCRSLDVVWHFDCIDFCFLTHFATLSLLCDIACLIYQFMHFSAPKDCFWIVLWNIFYAYIKGYFNLFITVRWSLIHNHLLFLFLWQPSLHNPYTPFLYNIKAYNFNNVHPYRPWWHFSEFHWQSVIDFIYIFIYLCMYVYTYTYTYIYTYICIISYM